MGLSGAASGRAIAAVAVLTVLCLAPGRSAANPPETVVLGPAAKARVAKRYVTRTRDSFRAAIASTGRLTVAERAISTACAVDVECLAKAGRAASADRVVGVLLAAKGKRFKLVFVVVDVGSGRQLARQEHTVRGSGALRTVPGELLRKLLVVLSATAAPAAAGGAESPDQLGKPVLVEVATKVDGTGRAVVPVRVSGGPPPRTGELEKAPELPRVECEGATTLPATPALPPAVLAPATSEARQISCVAHLRGGKSSFQLDVEPASRPGVYASSLVSRVVAARGPVQLATLSIDAKGRASTPTALRAEASSGTTSTDGADLTLELAQGRAPRIVAVALADGDRFGAAFVPVAGVAKLPIKAATNSVVEVRISGAWQPPVVVRRGTIDVPIEVPAGVQYVVVRATDANGYALESYADLNTPVFPRIGAVAPSDSVTVGRTTTIAIALATTSSRPADQTAKVVAAADRGRVGPPRFQGGGLWLVEYTAPTAIGPDEITVRVASDPAAGVAVVPVIVEASRASAIDVEVASGPFRPGERIAGTVTVRDGLGNAILDATAKLGDVDLALTSEGDRLRFEATIPDRLPEDRSLTLLVRAAGANVERSVRIPVRAGDPVSAVVRADSDDRIAKLTVMVRDRHGNLVDSDAFALRVAGATTEPLVQRRNGYRTTLHADAGVRQAKVEVVADETTLARARVAFGPPRKAFVLGAYASGGWVVSGQEFSAPRASVGVGMQRWLGFLELSALAGAEVFSFRDSPAVSVGGEDREASRSLVGVAFPVALRGRLRLSQRFGVALAAAVVPTRVSASVLSDFQSDVRYSELAVGVRGALSVDMRLGSARLRLGAEYGTAKLTDGPITGEIDGLAISAGYEWWFADLGP